MNIRLITYNMSDTTATKLGFPCTESLAGYSDDYDQDAIVRWGHSGRYYSRDGRRDEFRRVLNPAEAIQLNCRKYTATQEISKVVSTPRVWLHRVPSGVTAVVRPYEHTGGRGFEIVDGPCDISGSRYASEFIPTKMECRVWFCGTHTMVARRAKTGDRSERPCRSGWNYEFHTNDETGERLRFDPLLGADTLKAAKVIGLDCGAADVLCVPGRRVFLELNSAPSVDHWRIVDFFKSYLPVTAEDRFA